MNNSIVNIRLQYDMLKLMISVFFNVLYNTSADISISTVLGAYTVQ